MSTVTVTSAERTFTIVLTEREAAALYSVCGNIGGDPVKSPRGVFSSRSGSLSDQLCEYGLRRLPTELKSSIIFKDDA